MRSEVNLDFFTLETILVTTFIINILWFFKDSEIIFKMMDKHTKGKDDVEGELVI